MFCCIFTNGQSEMTYIRWPSILQSRNAISRDLVWQVGKISDDCTEPRVAGRNDTLSGYRHHLTWDALSHVPHIRIEFYAPQQPLTMRRNAPQACVANRLRVTNRSILLDKAYGAPIGYGVAMRCLHSIHSRFYSSCAQSQTLNRSNRRRFPGLSMLFKNCVLFKDGSDWNVSLW